MRIMLAVIYFLVVTPLGWTMRLFGFDPLALKKKPTWTIRRNADSESHPVERSK